MNGIKNILLKLSGIFLLFIQVSWASSLSYADVKAGRMEITEEDASPSTFPYQTKFSNGTVTDNGDGTTSINNVGSTSPIFTTDITIQSGAPSVKLDATSGNDIEIWLNGGILGIANTTNGKQIVRTTALDEFQTIQKLITEGGADLNGAVNASNASSFTLPNQTTIRGVTYTWPASDGTNGQQLSTNGSGTLSWTAQGSAGTPGGSDTQAQYNNASNFGGSSGLTLSATQVTALTMGGVSQPQIAFQPSSGNNGEISWTNGTFYLNDTTAGTGLLRAEPSGLFVPTNKVVLGESGGSSVDLINSSGNLTVNTKGGSFTVSSLNTNGGIHYSNASGLFAQTGTGTSTQVLHGGTSPSYGAVSLTADVSGILPSANGGTGQDFSASTGSTRVSSGTFSANTETGTGNSVLATSPTITTPSLTTNATITGTQPAINWDATTGNDGEVSWGGGAFNFNDTTAGTTLLRAEPSGVFVPSNKIVLGNSGGSSVDLINSSGNLTISPKGGSLTLSNFSTNGGLLYTNGTGSVSQTAAGTSTQVLHGGASPSYSAVSLANDITGTLAVGNGGSGATSLTGLLIGNGTSAFTATTTSAGVLGQVTDETGTGVLVAATSPTIATPSLTTSATLTGTQPALNFNPSAGNNGEISWANGTFYFNDSTTGNGLFRAEPTTVFLPQGNLVLGNSGGSSVDLQNSSGNLIVSPKGGDTRFNGTLTLGGVKYTMPTADGTNTQQLTTNGSGVLSWTAQGGGGGGTPGGSDTQVQFNDASAFGGSAQFTFTKGTGLVTVAPTARTSGSPNILVVTGPADTTLAASTEATDVNFNLARTVQFATGALATQRAVLFQAPTYSFVGASTLTRASTVGILGGPIAGTNATITNRHGLSIIATSDTDMTNGLYVRAGTTGGGLGTGIRVDGPNGSSLFETQYNLVAMTVTGPNSGFDSGGLNFDPGKKINIGAGQLHIIDNSGIVEFRTYNETRFLPGNLGGTGTRRISVFSQAAADVPFEIRGAASQSGNLQQWANSSAGILSSVDSSGILTLGLAGTQTGTLKFKGTTSGTVTVLPAAAAGTWTLTLPTAVGAAGQQLTDAAGDGITSWAAAGSKREMKNILGRVEPQEALSAILDTPVYRFKYKPGLGTGDYKTEYVGVMADEAPWAVHFNGTIVNPVNTLGYAVLGIQALQGEIEGLKRQNEDLAKRLKALE